MLGMDARGHESRGIVQDFGVDDEGMSGNLHESCGGVALNSREKEGTKGDENTGGFVWSVDYVNHETGDGIVIHRTVNKLPTESYSISEDVPHRGIVLISRELTGGGEDNKTVDVHNDELRSTDVIIDIGKLSQQGSGEPSSPVVQPHENSSNSDGGLVLETVIVINPENMTTGGRNREPVLNDKGLESSKVALDEPKTKVAKGEKQTCAVEKKFGACGGSIKENLDGESVCRICHLNSEAAVETSANTISTTNNTASMDLIQLGCGCKDELGIAHAHCAEAWFKLKGNRICEICGETAANITGVGDHRFMEEWNGRRSIGHNVGLSERRNGCWRGQPFCNFLMACLVIAFVLPWFFRVNLF